VESGGTAIGIRCKDGVVLALEKLITSKLLKPEANKRIATVDRNMGVVSVPFQSGAIHRLATMGLYKQGLILGI
jgi:20S proteasome alpha/beta subunit